MAVFLKLEKTLIDSIKTFKNSINIDQTCNLIEHKEKKVLVPIGCRISNNSYKLVILTHSNCGILPCIRDWEPNIYTYA